MLPIDRQLGLKDSDSLGEEWTSLHHGRLRTAFDLARQMTEKEALRRRERINQTADDTSLPIGARVFTRNRVLGRNKIQDVWNNVPHKVVARPFPEGNVYVVEPLDGNDAQKTIHRRDLLDTRTLVEDVNPDQDDENPPEGQPDVNHVGEKDQHEDGEPVEIIFHTKPPATNSGGQIHLPHQVSMTT